MTRTAFRFFVCLLMSSFLADVRAEDAALAARAQGVFRAYCYRCHGPAPESYNGFRYVLDRDRLVARGKVVPGKPAESKLYVRVVRGEMPPEGEKSRPSKEDVAVLRSWIEGGAPAWSASPAKGAFLAEADVLSLVFADLQTIDRRHRRYQRYFTLTHLANAGVSAEELEATRQALAKLINSLSWHSRVTRPQPIDPGKTVYRIDLRDYKWNARSWDRLGSEYPYRIPSATQEATALIDATGTEWPCLRADWFVATASRPPLYHDLLQLPDTDRALERLLQVDVAADIQEETAARAGFNGSGVSKNNRLIERHDAAYGAYWKTYDFAANVDRQNLFDRPLGPVPGQNSFLHAGGEIIFHLPNGLQAYLLVDGSGRRLDRAATEVVSDPHRPDRVVENGLSCISCHVRGILPKADQVRAHVEKNPTAFSPSDAQTIKALYPPEAKLRVLMEEDADRFVKALARTGVQLTGTEPVALVTLHYEDVLDRRAAAAELGLRPEDFAARLNRAGSLRRVLGPLQAQGGTVQRSAFQAAFAEAVSEFRLGEPKDSPLPSSVAPRPFTGHTGAVLSIAFSADRKRALSGSSDQTLRLWNVASGREIRRFEGHSEEVSAVAFSPDGHRALSGSRDRTLRLWDLESGGELRRFQGHVETISSVAFSPDGRQAISGSRDRTLRLWDLETGRELHCLVGHTHWVSSVAFSPDGRQVFSGGYDKTVRLWDVATGKELRRLEGHTREVYSVAFSPDGRRALSGGNDRTVRLWDLTRGEELRRLAGHKNAVIAVAFAPDGRQALSGSSRYEEADEPVRLWDLEAGNALRSFSGPPTEQVGSIAFAPDCRYALSANSEKSLRLWKLSK